MKALLHPIVVVASMASDSAFGSAKPKRKRTGGFKCSSDKVDIVTVGILIVLLGSAVPAWDFGKEMFNVVG